MANGDLLVLTDVEKCSFEITGVIDEAGNVVGDTSFDSPPTWNVSDSSLLTLDVPADGLSAEATVVGPLGTVQINVAAMKNGAPLTRVENVQITASAATGLQITHGTPEHK